jgi:hypothetical protein
MMCGVVWNLDGWMDGEGRRGGRKGAYHVVHPSVAGTVYGEDDIVYMI